MTTKRGVGENRSRKKGFVYKKRDPEAVKSRAEQTGGRFDSPFKPNVDLFRLKVGENYFRFLPPTWDDAGHYGYEVWVHQYVGPDSSTYLCPRKMLQKPCAICAAAQEAKDAGETDEAKQLAATNKYVSYVVNRDEDSDTPYVFMYSWSMDRDIAALCYNKRTGKALLIDHPEEGYDITIKRVGQGLKTKYIGMAVDRDPSPLHDDESVQDSLLDYAQENPIPDILHFYDNNYLASMISGEVDQKDEDEDDAKPKKPSRRRGRDEEEEEEDEPAPKRRRGKPDPDEEEEDEPAPKRRRRPKDEEEEEEDEPAPRRRRGKPDPDEEEEDEPAPKRRRGKPDPDEEEEEDEPQIRRNPENRRHPDDPEDEEEEDEPAPKRRRRPKDEEEEEEDEPAPKRRRGKPDPDEEEEEEEEPAPRRRRAKSDPDEEEEEEEPAPRRRRRVDPDEEEEEEEPRRKPKRRR